jgi:hypothetical protein
MQSSGANRTERVESERGAGFTDVHCHCLPGLDDGPPDVPSALACAAPRGDRIRTLCDAAPAWTLRRVVRCRNDSTGREATQRAAVES